jgi:hypothetical protein
MSYRSWHIHSLVISEGKIPGAMLHGKRRKLLNCNTSAQTDPHLLTRTCTPGRENSCAKSVFRWIVPALLTLYLKWCWVVRVMPEIEEMLMIVPV